jgi:hypothetical protein
MMGTYMRQEQIGLLAAGLLAAEPNLMAVVHTGHRKQNVVLRPA